MSGQLLKLPFFVVLAALIGIGIAIGFAVVAPFLKAMAIPIPIPSTYIDLDL